MGGVAGQHEERRSRILQKCRIAGEHRARVLRMLRVEDMARTVGGARVLHDDAINVVLVRSSGGRSHKDVHEHGRRPGTYPSKYPYKRGLPHRHRFSPEACTSAASGL